MDVLPQSTFIETLATQHRNIFEKLYAALKRFMRTIRHRFEQMTSAIPSEAAALKRDVDGAMQYAQRIVDLFDKAALAAVETVQSRGIEAAQTNEVTDQQTNENPTGKVRYQTRRKSPERHTLRELNIERIYIDFSDISSVRDVVSEVANDLVSRGKVVHIKSKNSNKFKAKMERLDLNGRRWLIGGILEHFHGEDVALSYGGEFAVAYLTKRGINHAKGGYLSAEKAAAVSKYYELIRNAEYAFSSEHDEHSKNGTP